MSFKELQDIKQKISDHRLKVTQQRMVIYQVLSRSKAHPTAETIYDKIKKKNPSISLGTVYKTLETFVEKGLVNRVNTAEGNRRYDARIDEHNHIFCQNTNEIVDFKDEELNQVIAEFLKRKNIENFDLKDFRLHINGDKIDPSKDIAIN